MQDLLWWATNSQTLDMTTWKVAVAREQAMWLVLLSPNY